MLAVPAAVLALAIGLLWLLGLLCDKSRREYVTRITALAMSGIADMFHGRLPQPAKNRPAATGLSPGKP